MTKNSDIYGVKPFNAPKTRLVHKTDSVVDSIVDNFISRAKKGENKYGQTLDRNDLSVLEWIDHAQQELMDGILYLEKLKKTLNG